MSTKTTLLDAAPGVALAPVESGGVSMFERLATDQNVSVEKIERLMALWERGEAKKAEASFNASMSKAQRAMRPVVADSYNSQTRSKYPSYEALDRALRPIYTEHGFGLSFNTGESPLPEHIRMLCKVTHDGGHCEHYHIDMPADGKGAKGGDVMTKTHAAGSAVSYGMRYLLKMIFNVAVSEEDDDGNKAGRKVTLEKPKGYDDWLMDIEAVAAEGLAALEKTWKTSKVEYRQFIRVSDPEKWEALKATAAKAAKGAA